MLKEPTEQELETLRYAAQAAGSSNANLRATAGGVLRNGENIDALYAGYRALEDRLLALEAALGGADAKAEPKKTEPPAPKVKKGAERAAEEPGA